MANIDFDNRQLQQARHLARRSAHVQRAQQMLVAAGLASLCVIAVAGALLSQAA